MKTAALMQKVFGVVNPYDLVELGAQIDQLTPENIVFLSVFYGAHAGAALFAVKTCIFGVSRALGVSHPNQYSKYPRLPWRRAYRIWLVIQRWYERVFLVGKHGPTGGFAGVLATLTLLYTSGYVLLGRAQAFDFGLPQPVGIKPQRHLFCYAQTGSGKTTLLITMLECWKGSALVIDPKAQIVDALAEKDRKRQWYVFDPYRISKAGRRARINFFDCIKEAMAREGTEAAVIWAIRISEALVITEKGSRSPFFPNAARDFVKGLILHVLTAYPEENHNLPFVRDLIVVGCRVFNEDGSEETQGKEAQLFLLDQMSKNTAFGITIPGAAAAISSASGETGGNIRSTLQEQTKWLDIPQLREDLIETTISISELKKCENIVWAVTAPITSIREELSGFIRVTTNVTLYTFQDVKEKKGQCLLACDELPSQGYNAALPVILAVARSFGLVFFGIAQNVELMKSVYPDSWKSFSGEADATFWMGCTHSDSAKYLEEQLGTKTLVEKDKYSGRKSYRQVSVMDADQIKRYLDPNSGNVIVTRAGGRPLRLKNEPYFDALPVWAYSQDHDHREPFLRAMMRRLFTRNTERENPSEIISPIDTEEDEDV